MLTKEETRNKVWDLLQERGVARFPYPPHNRIPNFERAKKAAENLLTHPLAQKAKILKVNPDAPQRYFRIEALRAGKCVYMPSPRLRKGFLLLDPERIESKNLKEAASLSKAPKYAREVRVEDLPAVDLIVTGSVAVTKKGKRCGKGHGYSDLEYAILRELGHPAPPVATTVHELQVVDDFAADAHDLPVNIVATPERVFETLDPPEPPDGILWELLTEEELNNMPPVKRLKYR